MNKNERYLMTNTVNRNIKTIKRLLALKEFEYAFIVHDIFKETLIDRELNDLYYKYLDEIFCELGYEKTDREGFNIACESFKCGVFNVTRKEIRLSVFEGLYSMVN
jgi:hypothetical protein